MCYEKSLLSSHSTPHEGFYNDTVEMHRSLADVIVLRETKNEEAMLADVIIMYSNRQNS